MALERRTFLGGSLGAPMAGVAAQAPTRPNAVIQRAWATALDALKPSRKELEHGLELHRSSLVFDSYGFAPRAALDGDAVRGATEAGASEIELQDLREDISMTRCVTSAAERAEFQEAWKASGVTCIFQNCGEESQDPLVLLKRLARFTYVTDMMRDFVRKAVTPDDIVAAKKLNKQCLYFTGNGVPLTQAWVSVEDELRYVRVFFQLGIRMMHVTYNRRNMLGDGCAEPSNAGLSDFGRAAVAQMNRVGIIVDVAHSGWQTSLEAAKVSKKPTVASHSGCAAVNQHIRCKPDEVIRAIADTGGLIGICCIPRFLGRSADIAALLDHIDYASKRFGMEHVAIGTDVAYTSQNAEAENKKIPRGTRTRTRFAALWPPDAIGGGNSARAQSLAWTNWPLFTVGLVQRGYSDTDIQKILGGNMLRVARAVLPPNSE
ncbi:MAG: membrane dipeptidase [Acidobacteria bacterium]|nr:membrane dipeptidase [Acidobacteriota bacterium]